MDFFADLRNSASLRSSFILSHARECHPPALLINCFWVFGLSSFIYLNFFCWIPFSLSVFIPEFLVLSYTFVHIFFMYFLCIQSQVYSSSFYWNLILPSVFLILSSCLHFLDLLVICPLILPSYSFQLCLVFPSCLHMIAFCIHI